MSGIIDKLTACGSLTQEQADRIRANVAEFEKCAEEHPEFHEEALQKLAGPFGVMVPETMRMIGATAVAAGGAALAGDVYRTAKDAIMKSRNYKAMLDENPELRHMDAKAVQKAFNTLSNFNPQYASDPMVAGDFVKNQVNQQGMDYNRLKNIIESGSVLSKGGPPSAANYMSNPATIAGLLRFQHNTPHRA